MVDLKYPKISIITPSYNQVEFLGKAIESVLNQNYPNLEYIIIDGGSTDGSKELIESYNILYSLPLCKVLYILEYYRLYLRVSIQPLRCLMGSVEE